MILLKLMPRGLITVVWLKYRLKQVGKLIDMLIKILFVFYDVLGRILIPRVILLQVKSEFKEKIIIRIKSFYFSFKFLVK